MHENSPDKYISLKNTTDKAACILIYGFDKMGQALLSEVAYSYHFAHDKTTQVIIVDSEISEKKKQYYRLQPNIEKVVDVEFLDEAEFEKNFSLYASKIDLCFLAGELDSWNYIISHRIRQKFFEFNLSKYKPSIKDEKDITKKELLSKPKIVLESSHFDDVFEMLEAEKNSDFDKLKICVERMYQKVCVENKLLFGNEIIDYIARQIFIYYCLEDKKSGKEKQSHSEKWEFLTDDEKDQNRWAARHMFIKIRYLNSKFQLPSSKNEIPAFSKNKEVLLNSLENVSGETKILLAKWEHRRWIAEKYLTGFVEGVNLKDEKFYKTILKTRLRWHECLVPWEKLSPHYQSIDEKLTDLKNIISDLNFNEIIKS